ncbi:MAG TPA: pitrilysin family protein [Spirochaetota bacterium]|nr:pitrilysin family protein [Spirochaetota bacterium]HPN83267.1 pitrilysin family protein [Spirochaetota bacterium]
MPARLILALVLLLLLAVHLPAASTVFTLPNGLETIVFPRPDVPLVSIQFSIRHGYIYANDPLDEGIAHFYEHMLFKANSLTKTQQEFMRRLNEIGAAGWNGTTGSEAVTYYLTVPATEAERALELWSAVLIDTVFDPPEIRREISVVSNEIEGNRRDPGRAFWRLVNAALYGQDQMYRTGHYETAHMGRFDRALLQREQARWYTPDNCMLSLSGAIDEREALQLVSKHFSRWKRGTPRPVTRPLQFKPRTDRSRNLVLGGFTNPGMLRVLLLWPGPSVLSNRNETLTADVLSYYLSEKSGGFLASLTTNTALFSTDTAGFTFSTGRYTSEFMFQGEIPATNIPGLLARASLLQNTVRQALARIAEGKARISPESIRRIASRIINDRIFRHEKPPALLQDVSWWWCTADLAYWQHYDRGIATVTPRALQRLARDWLAKPPLPVLWAHDSLRAALEQQGGPNP